VLGRVFSLAGFGGGVTFGSRLGVICGWRFGTSRTGGATFRSGMVLRSGAVFGSLGSGVAFSCGSGLVFF
jgi:hypothetical protein